MNKYRVHAMIEDKDHLVWVTLRPVGVNDRVKGLRLPYTNNIFEDYPNIKIGDEVSLVMTKVARRGRLYNESLVQSQEEKDRRVVV